MAADTNASLAADLGLAAVFANMEFAELLHESRDLKAVCRNVPFVAGAGSATMKIRQIQVKDTMTAPGEDTAPAITNFTTGNATLTVARSTLLRSVSDLALISGEMDAKVVAKSFAASLIYRRSLMISALSAGLTANTAVGTSTVGLTVDTVYAAIFALRKAFVSGSLDFVGHEANVCQFLASLRGETATPLQIAAETQGALASDHSGDVEFTWMNTRFRSHASVPTANGGLDYSCMLVGEGCLGYTEAPVASILRQYAFNPVAMNGETAIIVNDLSTETKGSRSWVCHSYMGVGELEDARGIQIIAAV